MDNSSSPNFNKKSAALLGLVSGLLNGLFGSGGGTIAVFGMQKYLGVETHKSHATSIAVILPLSVISLVVYAKNGLPDLWLLLYVSIGGVLGGFVGAKLLKKIKSSVLHKAFGIVMIAAAVRLIFK